MTGVLMRRHKETQRQTGAWHVTAAVETGVSRLQAKKHQRRQPPKAGEDAPISSLQLRELE